MQREYNRQEVLILLHLLEKGLNKNPDALCILHLIQTNASFPVTVVSFYAIIFYHSMLTFLNPVICRLLKISLK